MPTRRHPGPKGPRSRERHWLYQEAVQSPDVHFGFFDRAYRERNGRLPLSLKEDFCGTALLSTDNKAAGAKLTPNRIETAINYVDKSNVDLYLAANKIYVK